MNSLDNSPSYNTKNKTNLFERRNKLIKDLLHLQTPVPVYVSDFEFRFVLFLRSLVPNISFYYAESPTGYVYLDAEPMKKYSNQSYTAPDVPVIQFLYLNIITEEDVDKLESLILRLL